MIDTVLPDRLKLRPRDARGYVIPFVQFIYPGGKPDFRVLDNEKVDHVLRTRKCALCGEPMGRHIFFLGGPPCVENGYFYDPPMHRECALHSLMTCPHLARSKGKYSAPIVDDAPANVKIVVSDIKIEKPDWFALMHARDYTFSKMQSGMTTVRAKLPWIEVLRFRDGVEI